MPMYLSSLSSCSVASLPRGFHSLRTATRGSCRLTRVLSWCKSALCFPFSKSTLYLITTVTHRSSWNREQNILRTKHFLFQYYFSFSWWVYIYKVNNNNNKKVNNNYIIYILFSPFVNTYQKINTNCNVLNWHNVKRTQFVCCFIIYSALSQGSSLSFVPLIYRQWCLDEFSMSVIEEENRINCVYLYVMQQ